MRGISLTALELLHAPVGGVGVSTCCEKFQPFSVIPFPSLHIFQAEPSQ